MNPIHNFRAHYVFIEDCLQAYVVAACVEELGVQKPDEKPKPGKGPSHMLHMSSEQDQCTWLFNLGKKIYEKHVKGMFHAENIIIDII